MRVQLDTSVEIASRGWEAASLAVDVYLPDHEGPRPTLLCRTPYDRQDAQYVSWAVRFVEAGYAVVIQDCRGRYASSGEWAPYLCEEADGVATLQWLEAQDFCDGRVGMFGISYVGFVQSLAAASGHPALKGVVPTASQEDNFGHMWLDGVFQLENAVNFAFYVGRRTMNASSARYVDLSPIYECLPLKGALSSVVPDGVFDEFLDHPTFDGYWQQTSLKDRYQQINAPACFITGWYDNLLGEQLKLFGKWKTQAGSREARRDSRIIVGPWSHFGLGTRECGGVDFGDLAARDLPSLHLEFYDSVFFDLPSPSKPIEIFVMGENVWRGFDEWPPADCARTRFFLHARDSAQARSGGLDRIEPGATEAPDRFVYDPRVPVPTVGGPCMLDANTGPQNRAHLWDRDDILLFESGVLEVALEVTGPVTLVLYAASNAVDTDFSATLVDLQVDGTARNVCEGIVRVRYRESLDQPMPMVPHQVYRLEVSLWSTSYVFAPGHRMVLEVSSSNFPRCDRNLNTWQKADGSAELKVAEQTIFHDVDRPSHLVVHSRQRHDLTTLWS